MTLHLDTLNSIPRLLAHSQRLLQFLFVRGHPLSHFGVICKLSQTADKLLHRLVHAIDKISGTGVGPEPGLEKTRVFLKNPAQWVFLGFFWVFGFFWFFLGFFAQTRGF
jgi:hypothetical protein